MIFRAKQRTTTEKKKNKPKHQEKLPCSQICRAKLSLFFGCQDANEISGLTDTTQRRGDLGNLWFFLLKLMEPCEGVPRKNPKSNSK